ncbi:GNAT family N-acetyltransferase [Mycoplasmatota bacterium WC44]
MKQVIIKKVTEDNYNQFLCLTEWRRTSVKPRGETKFKLALEDDRIGLFDLVEKDLMHIYMAIIDEEVAGYVSAAVIPKPDKRIGTMFEDELWVPEEYRNNGIARKLMNKVIESSEEMGLWKTRLYVDVENLAGINCYESVGMKREEGSCYFYQK